mgnify:CR=1 FL=1
MGRLQQIEDQIRKLSTEELQSLRAWFFEFDAELWDRQFESDVNAGKLDDLAQRAIDDHTAGRSREL